MSGKLPRWYLPLGAAAVVLAAASPAAAAGVVDPGPIGADQAFVGVVNGVSSGATILVACDGPAIPGATGHPLNAQRVKVLPADPAATGPAVGFTGSPARRIGVSFGTDVSSAPPVTLSFYQTGVEIPTDVVVPCAGTGAVTFATSPGNPTARPATVTVTFTTRLPS
jgi:hypothetical protein